MMDMNGWMNRQVGQKVLQKVQGHTLHGVVVSATEPGYQQMVTVQFGSDGSVERYLSVRWIKSHWWDRRWCICSTCRKRNHEG